MYYIENNDKPRFLESMFKIIKIEGNKLILPLKTKNINKKYLAKLARKTKKILDKTKSKKIVLSKILKENEEYKNILYTYGFDIVDGKWLFEVISCEVLDYIVNLENIKKEDTEISILVNYITQNTLENIKKIARQYKRLNIVTNHIEKLKKIEEELYNKEGIMIIVTNNKKKSLSKSKIILNIDFSEEQLINLDAKSLDKNGTKFVIAQVNTVSIEDVLKRQEKLENAMNKEIEEKGLSLFVLAITDILNSNSEIIALGSRIDAVEKGFGKNLENNRAFLEGVVSRKKQLLPQIDKNI